MKTREDILQIIEEEDVEFIRLQFVDMFGNLKNIAVTPSQLDRVLNNEYFFEGSALFDQQYSSDEEYYLKPDLDSFVILSWRPQQGRVGKFMCDVVDAEGNPVALSPRAILERTLQLGKEKGYRCMVDSECEFFLFHTDDNGMPTVIAHEQAGYLDVGPADLGENARREMVLNLEEMGFDIESSHHEKAPAQHEIDFREGEGMKTADALVSFKFAVRSIAKRFGLYATFMPKPKMDAAGSGMHLNFSLYKDGVNIFDEDENKAKYFVGGVMKYAREMAAITNPTINSYKRILSGYKAPREINWAKKGENIFAKVRKSFGTTKVELRFPDPSANPYLALTVCLYAGFVGMKEKIEPEELVKSWSEEQKYLPDSLKEALNELKKSEFMKKVLGEEFLSIYLEVKEQEWKEYMLQVSDWEINRYLVKL